MNRRFSRSWVAVGVVVATLCGFALHMWIGGVFGRELTLGMAFLAAGAYALMLRQGRMVTSEPLQLRPSNTRTINTLALRRVLLAPHLHKQR